MSRRMNGGTFSLIAVMRPQTGKDKMEDPRELRHTMSRLPSTNLGTQQLPGVQTKPDVVKAAAANGE